jgi:site-specific recombinase XerD
MVSKSVPAGCSRINETSRSPRRTGKIPSRLEWTDLDAEVVAAFLEHLKHARHNGARTRDLRLTAVRSLSSFAALRHAEHAELIQRVLAIPAKRFDNQLITFLTATEIDALIDAPHTHRWEGRRDRALLLLTTQTELRVSELTGLNCGWRVPILSPPGVKARFLLLGFS